MVALTFAGCDVSPMIEANATVTPIHRTGAIGSNAAGDTLAYVSGDEIVRIGAAGSARMRLGGNPCVQSPSFSGNALALTQNGRSAIVFGVGDTGPGPFSGSTEGTRRFITVACKVDFERQEARPLAEVHPGVTAFGDASASDVRIVFGDSGALYVWRKTFSNRGLFVVPPDAPTTATKLIDMPGYECDIAEHAGTLAIGCTTRSSRDATASTRASSSSLHRSASSRTPRWRSRSTTTPSSRCRAMGSSFPMRRRCSASASGGAISTSSGRSDLERLAAGPRVLPFQGHGYESAVAVLSRSGDVVVTDGGKTGDYGLHVLRVGTRPRYWELPAAASILIPFRDSDDVWVVTLEKIYRLRP